MTLTEQIDLPGTSIFLTDTPAVRNLTRPYIVGTAVATPPQVAQDDLWEFFRDHFAANPLAEKVWASSGIVSRHYAVDPRKEPTTEWTTGERMRRYLTEALPLGRQAAADALTSAGLTPADLGLFAVVSCTGYVTPGLDILLSHELGMPANMRRVIIGHMGCHAAVPGLGTVSEYVAVHGKPALLLCVELSSLHAQPKSPTLHAGNPTIEDFEQIVAHSLFADGAAAVVVAPDQQPASAVASQLEIVDVMASTDSSVSDYMGWLVTDHGFRMRLSPQVPEVLERHVTDLVTTLLSTHGHTIDDVDGWAIHPGGARILRAVADQLQLSEEATAPSYDILREYGNCSSATVLIILQRLLRTREIRPGKVVVALGFGPGLTLFAALLKAH
ncbi:3-Oxoacyl-(acyl-carrier-protein (ACP)) synthase III domain-containing protein [Candidatus Protofrankia datiscae]|uniref:3-Oxoacyl-(Acyl-carrier-protein (ACP)) synthase III domain-containing protein n=1 Tax=Candidatus Protofrankia datiscae TaxID=2716812 RepID=F8AXQ9_9ACTN|nr:3-oxoacyl-[acyl-carrier-protein] synthase III C-terminal domain-containing protein [Candidatus Protofrankia datiscae]AEH11477.1 3-Oxoacyl-(acyl-carrier-protein (ACP)) synthase III domain-containing protein [Candidatus Protofrankia datiscae]